MFKDLLGNTLEVGDRCYFLKTYTTSVHVGIVEIVELYEKGAKCLVVEPNPTRDSCRGIYWDKGRVTKHLALTNLMYINR